MKKLLILAFILSLAAMGFAQDVGGAWIELSALPDDIFNYVNTPYQVNDPDFSLSVVNSAYPATVISTATHNPLFVSVFIVDIGVGNMAWAFVDMQVWANNWPIGSTLTLTLTYLPTGMSDTYSVIVPDNGYEIFMTDLITPGTTWNINALLGATVDPWTYNLQVNGPAGYAVTGPVNGVLPYTATDAYDLEPNLLLGDYTAAAAPQYFHWLVNPITVTAGMFTAAKTDYVYNATITFELLDNIYTVSIGESTPAGAAIWFNGENTGFTAPHAFTGTHAQVHGIYTLKYPNHADKVLDASGDASFEFTGDEVKLDIILTVTSNPSGSGILINGVDSGFETPHTFENPVPGTYSMSPSYWHWDPESVVVGTLTEDLTLHFTASPWLLNVASDPPGYGISKNGVATGQVTPHVFSSFTAAELAGTYTLAPVAGAFWTPAQWVVTTADFNPARAQLSLASAGDRDPEYDHSISFVLDYYTLAVTSTPVSGAAIYKDGVATGQVTPYTFDPGTAGVYSVSKAGWTWTPATQTVPVPTQNTAVSFTGALQPPTGLAATVVSAAQINLGWTDNTTQESGFKIERKIGAGGTWSQITTVGANVTSYNNTGLSQNTSYYYRVRAYYSSTNSAYSNEANATTPYATPAAPSVLTATALSSSLISLSWTDNSDNETGFKIERKIGAGGSWAQIITPPANSNSTTNVGLTQNTAYYYRIRATNVNVDSPYSNEATATTLYSTPTVPQALAATVISSAQINLSWTDNSALETGFKLERKTGAGGTWAEIASLDANVSSYNNTGLSQNTSYYYRIRAFNVNAYSDYSNEASATTLYTTPSAPTALTAAVVSASQVNLAWTDNSTVETGYKIERKTGSGGTWSEIATVAANVTAYNNSGIDHGYTYYYRVRAYNVSVNSPYSNEASATPVAPPVLSFSANATEVLELVSLQFTDSSTPGSGTISAWLWNFGDGSSSTLQNPSHAYQSAGLYSVSLTVTNSFNASSSLTRTDYIHILLRVPEIALVPGNTVDFGATYMGTQGVQSLLVKNIGSAVLTLQSVSLALSGTPFDVQDRAYPLQIDAGDSTYIQLQFTPPYPGSYSNILNLVNNSVNQPQTSLILTGTGVLAAPLAPQNLSFSCSGSNAVLTWNAVTQTVADTPVMPDYYFIYRSSLPEGPYTVFGLSTGLSYELPIAGLEEGCMFYHVSALKFYAKNLQPADLDASVQSRIRPGMTEAEVGQVIREIEGF